MSQKEYKCIVCGVELISQPIEDDSVIEAIMDGVRFTSRPPYNSTAFDPIDDYGTFAEICVCDLCLRSKRGLWSDFNI